MSHILFLIYTAVFAVSFFVGGEEIHIVIGILSGVAVFYGFFRRFYLTARQGYYRKRYLGQFLAFAVMLPYALFPLRVASVIAYVCIALWCYVLPACRWAAVRIFYVRMIKKACRERNYKTERVRGGILIRTQGKVYDVRMVGSLRRVGLWELCDGTHYTVRWVPSYVAERTEYLAFLFERQESLPFRLLIGRARRRTFAWTESLAETPNAERVAVFLPGLCEWKFTGAGEARYTNGSMTHGVRLYEADAFAEKLR